MSEEEGGVEIAVVAVDEQLDSRKTASVDTMPLHEVDKTHSALPVVETIAPAVSAPVVSAPVVSAPVVSAPVVSPNISLNYEIGPPGTHTSDAVRTAVYQVTEPSNIFPISATPVQDDETAIVFNFENAPWNVVLRQFCERAGMALEMKAQPPTLFTYHDDQPHTVNDALDILNGFLIRDGFILVRHGHLMLLVDVENIPLHLVESLPVDELSTRSRFELVSVEVKVDEVPVEEMSKQLQPLLSPLGHIVPLSSAYRLVVTDLREKVEEVVKFIRMANIESAKVISEVIQLRNIKAEDVVQSLQQTMGKQVTVATAGKSASPRGASPVVSVVETNALVIKGRPIELARIRKVIADLDRSPAQVHIQAVLVEVELADTDEFGVEFGIQDSLLFRRSVVDDVLTITESTADPGTGIITTTENIISQVTNPGFHFNGAVPGNNTAQNPGRLAGQALANLSVGRTNPLEGHGGLVLSAGNESLNI
ncbi:MAG: secretin N-terminal domain-containing protein, partial [Planctomycetaceae bacterium]